jgi:hypothetical protein
MNRGQINSCGRGFGKRWEVGTGDIMSNRGSGAIHVLAVFLAVLSCAPSVRADVAVGDKPQLRGVALDGTRVDLSALRGKLVVVDFWISHSDLDKNFERHLIDVLKKYNDQGVVFVGVCCDARPADAEKGVRELQIPWPVLNDTAGWRAGVGREWGVPRVNWDYLISPDGAVLWIGSPQRIEDQIDTALLQHPPVLVDPAIVAKATADLDAAEQALADHDRGGAVQHFMHAAEGAKKDRQYFKRYAALKPRVEQAADELLAEADPLIDNKDYGKAANYLHGLAELFKGLPEETDARQKLAKLLADPDAKAAIDAERRENEAAVALNLARKLRDEQHATEAYRKFKSVAQDYPETTAGHDAASAVAAYEADPQFMRDVRDDAVAAKAKPLLGLADSYRTAGKLDQARDKYQDVIRQFPDTRFAETAKRRLEEMK